MMRILLVDDDQDFRELISSTVPAGIEILSFASTEELRRHSVQGDLEMFDMALIDQEMPPHIEAIAEKEGFALGRWLRSRGTKVPMILVSSHPFNSGKSREDQVLFMGYLRKPVSLKLLHGFLVAYDRLFVRGRER